MTKAKVAVLKTTPETVLDDYARLIEMGEAQKHLDRNATTILKDNISWHFMYPGANTTPWQLEGTILGLQKLGYQDQVCVQNETVVINAFKGERLNKFVPIFEKYNLPVKYNFRPEEIKWVEYKPKGQTLVLHKIYPKGITLPEYFFGKNIVHLPTVKCHVYTTYTGAMKNAFGGLLTTRRHYTHTWIHETLVDLLMIQREIHTGLFNIMDGTTAGNGPGPRTMWPVVKDYILASGDPVAIDAVAAKLMGFDPLSIPCIRIAHDKGLGVGDPREIEIAGEDITNVNFHFQTGHNAATGFVKYFWWGFLKPLQKLFFHTPLVYFFVLGSYVFHDYIWYPFKGIPRVRRWLRTTKWGQLFLKYPGKFSYY